MEQLDLLSYKPPAQYPHAPAARRTDTSRDAAKAMSKHHGSIQRSVLLTIKACGKNGATSREIAKFLNIPYEAVQPRTSELKRLGLIVDSGMRRVSRAEDKLAIVWSVK